MWQISFVGVSGQDYSVGRGALGSTLRLVLLHALVERWGAVK